METPPLLGEVHSQRVRGGMEVFNRRIETQSFLLIPLENLAKAARSVVISAT